jgi:hypothetical protein
MGGLDGFGAASLAAFLSRFTAGFGKSFFIASSVVHSDGFLRDLPNGAS